jgi:hypothetical protein
VIAAPNWPRFARVLWTRLRATPRASAISRTVRPSARKRAMWEASTLIFGRPSLFPLARAFRNPARTRSAMSERSHSATAPKTVKTIVPVGVPVSICSLRLTNATPRALKVSRARSGWETERANRSNTLQSRRIADDGRPRPSCLARAASPSRLICQRQRTYRRSPSRVARSIRATPGPAAPVTGLFARRSANPGLYSNKSSRVMQCQIIGWSPEATGYEWCWREHPTKDILAQGGGSSAYWPPKVLRSVAIDTCGQLKGTGGLSAGRSGKLSNTVCTYCSCMK